MSTQPALFAPPPDAPRLATVRLPAGVHATARWSDDRRYRWTLTWSVAPFPEGPHPVVIGLNPSGASEQVSDRTLNRVYSFLGCGFTMLNLFGLRATLPEELGKSADPIGADNDYWIMESIKRASFVVVAWGSPPSGRVGSLVHDRIIVVRKVLRGLDVRCWGLTQQGYPRHPSRMENGVALERWEGR